jgi:hypothetical protein
MTWKRTRNRVGLACHTRGDVEIVEAWRTVSKTAYGRRCGERERRYWCVVAGRQHTVGDQDGYELLRDAKDVGDEWLRPIEPCDSPVCGGLHRVCRRCAEPLGCLFAGSHGPDDSWCLKSLLRRYAGVQLERNVRSKDEIEKDVVEARRQFVGARPGTPMFERLRMEVAEHELKLRRARVHAWTKQRSRG